MGSVQGQDVRGKEGGQSCKGWSQAGVWMGQDRLRPTHLRAMLSRLLDQEQEEWAPSILKHSAGDSNELDTRDRSTEVWWIWGACERLGWGHETRFTAVVLLDRVLHRVKVPQRYLHAVTAATVFLAAKIHEEDENVPATVEVVERGEMGCTWRELLRMERVCVDKLCWHLPHTSSLNLLQVLHALAITTAPRHTHISRVESPTQQLCQLTLRLWCVVAHGSTGYTKPSILVLALLSLELDDTHTPEAGVILWLQALTQVSDEELTTGRTLVEQLLHTTKLPYTSAATTAPYPIPSASLAPSASIASPIVSSRFSRPNKRSLENEDEVYQDIKKLYAFETQGSLTQGPKTLEQPSVNPPSLAQGPKTLDNQEISSEQLNNQEMLTEKLASLTQGPKIQSTFEQQASSLAQGPENPASLSQGPKTLDNQEMSIEKPSSLTQGPEKPANLTQGPKNPEMSTEKLANLTQGPEKPASLAQGPENPLEKPASLTQGPEKPASLAQGPKKRRRRKSKPTFKAKNMKSCLKQALKIPCKISLIPTKRGFEEESEASEGEEGEEEMEVEEQSEASQNEEPLVEPVGLLKSPVFWPMSPEFPDIKHHVVRKEDICWMERAQEVAEQMYRPLTYAQVLRLHLTPLTRALGV